MTKTDKKVKETAVNADKDASAPKSETEAVVAMPVARRWTDWSVLLVLVAAVVGWVMASIFLMNVEVDGASLRARSSDAQLASLLNQKVASYKLAIGYPDGSIKKFSLQQVGLYLDSAASVQTTRQQEQTLIQRFGWWRPVPAVVVFDEHVDTFNDFITQQAMVTVQPAKDATLTIKSGKIVMADAVTGKQYGLSNPKPTLLAAVQTLDTHTIKLKELAVNPALTANLLAPYKTLLESTIDQPAKFVIGSQTVQPSPSQIASWLDIMPDDKTKRLDIAVNSGKVSAYISSIATAAVQLPRAQVIIDNADGSKRILVPGVNGVGVVNQAGIAKAVSQELLSGKGFSYNLPVGIQPYETITAGDYPKWIEVDVTNKVLYAYEHGTLVQSYLVSAGAPATPTVLGQYRIYAKLVQQNMSGLNTDGTSYYAPDVPWIDYFYGSYSIHGNYWRPLSYFGHINSSHGCVGLTVADAEWIYNWAPVGTPVIIHQ